MERLKNIPKSRINKVRNFPNESGLAYRKYGKSGNINDYTDREIIEMIYGIYKDQNMLLVDGDYFINLNQVKSSCCILNDVSYYEKPIKEDFQTNAHNTIGNIRTFYIKDYFLITDDEVNGNLKHRITKYLHKIGSINQGRNNFRGLYSISNDYKTLLNGKYPKDLFHPIKRYINGLFFDNDYRISEFVVESNIKIETGN